MFKKSFAEMLKENLNDDSFKPPPVPPPPRQVKKIFPDITDEFLLEIKKYYITVKDIERIYGSRSFYKKLFKEPVKRIFYWCEEEWQGSLFVVFQYKNRYIYVNGYFGSCEVCDGFPQDEESLERTFRNIGVCNDINDITLGYKPEFVNPDLSKDFEKFKNKILKSQNKKLQNTQKSLNSPTNTVQQTEPKLEPESKRQESKIITSWASLFK